MGMSRREVEKIFEHYFLHRVLFVPLQKPNLFVFIFGQGDLVKLGKDLVVVWDDRRNKYDYFPCKNLPEWPSKDDAALDAFNELVSVSFVKEFAEDRNRGSIHNRKTNWISAKLVQHAMKTGESFWKKIPLRSHNKKLKINCRKDPLLKRLLIGSVSCVDFMVRDGARCMTVKDIATRNFVTKLKPCPYRVVRRFLKHIGIEPHRQGGKEQRLRLSKEDDLAIRSFIEKAAPNGKPTKKIIMQAFEENKLDPPTPHIFKKYQLANV